MKESFVFYESFLNALDELDSETELKIYRAITHYALRNEEPELTGTALAIFHLIKPQIDANNKRYEDGKKGGRPKNEIKKTSGFENIKPVVLQNEEIKKPNVNVNVNVNDNVNENVNDNVNVFKEKKLDPFINPIKTFFQQEYTKVMGRTPRLSLVECNRIIELANENKDFKDILPDALKRLKKLKFDGINYTPSANWLLKENNFERLINGEFEPPESEYERLKRKFGGSG